MRKGDAAASEAALSGIRQIKQGDYLKEIARRLEMQHLERSVRNQIKSLPPEQQAEILKQLTSLVFAETFEV